MKWCVLAFLCALARAQDLQDRPVKVFAPRQLPTGSSRLMMFDVRDLLTRGRDEEAGPSLDQATQALAGLIRGLAEPPIKDDQTVKCLNGTLIVSGSGGQQDWIAGFLRQNRDRSSEMIDTEVRCLRVPADAKGLDLGEGTKTIPAHELEAWIERAKTQGADVLTAPRLSTWPLQAGVISILNQLAYVKAYEVYERVEPSGARIVDPIVETVQEGLVIEMCGGLLEGGNVGLQLQIMKTDVERPIATLQTQYGEIGVPNVQTLRVDSHLKLGPNAAAVFSVAGHKDERLAVIVTARRTAPPK